MQRIILYLHVCGLLELGFLKPINPLISEANDWLAFYGMYFSFDSLLPGWCGSNYKSIVFKLIIENSSLVSRCGIAHMWMPLIFTNEKSTLVHVMALCCQAPGHYLSQFWPRSMSSYVVIRLQWVKCLMMQFRWVHVYQGEFNFLLRCFLCVLSVSVFFTVPNLEKFLSEIIDIGTQEKKGCLCDSLALGAYIGCFNASHDYKIVAMTALPW